VVDATTTERLRVRNLARHVRLTRECLGWSADDLAEAAGLLPAIVSNFERGNALGPVFEVAFSLQLALYAEASAGRQAAIDAARSFLRSRRRR
jgi:transcriptional regulator with XRE-family HTH domain